MALWGCARLKVRGSLKEQSNEGRKRRRVPGKVFAGRERAGRGGSTRRRLAGWRPGGSLGAGRGFRFQPLTRHAVSAGALLDSVTGLRRGWQGPVGPRGGSCPAKPRRGPKATRQRLHHACTLHCPAMPRRGTTGRGYRLGKPSEPLAHRYAVMALMAWLRGAGLHPAPPRWPDAVTNGMGMSDRVPPCPLPPVPPSPPLADLLAHAALRVGREGKTKHDEGGPYGGHRGAWCGI